MKETRCLWLLAWILVLGLFLLVPASARAEIYKRADKGGKLFFSNVPVASSGSAKYLKVQKGPVGGAPGSGRTNTSSGAKNSGPEPGQEQQGPTKSKTAEEQGPPSTSQGQDSPLSVLVPD